jgi:hypothetical protein
MRYSRNVDAWTRTRVAFVTAVGHAIQMSRAEPHKLFWIVALPAFGVKHRKVLGFTIHSPVDILDEKPKYTVCAVMNGEVIRTH